MKQKHQTKENSPLPKEIQDYLDSLLDLTLKEEEKDYHNTLVPFSQLSAH